MRKILIYLVPIILFALSLPAQENSAKPLLLIDIDGKFASQATLDLIPAEEIVQMHYLMPLEGRKLYGLAEAGGVLLVKTNGKPDQKDILDGKSVPSAP